MAKSQDRHQVKFPGFSSPRFTQVPDEIMDTLMPDLSEAELKVLLYIVRRTFGFGKDADAISLNQMTYGIQTRDGRVLDRGTGLSRSSVRRGVAGLEGKGIITVSKVKSPDGDYESNVYRLRFREQGAVSYSNHPEPRVVSPQNHPGLNLEPGVVLEQNSQETVTQETDARKRSVEISTGPHPKFDPDRQAISDVMRDFARELGDTAPLPATISRAYNVYRSSEVDLDTFLDALYEARRITQERTASIRTEIPKKLGSKPKVGYYFAVLDNLLKQAS